MSRQRVISFFLHGDSEDPGRSGLVNQVQADALGLMADRQLCRLSQQRRDPASQAAAIGHELPRMMIVDEVHHLLAGTVREQRQSLNQLKFLSNELRMPVVALGTSEALYAMQADPQIASRFEPFALPRWRESTGLREFVVGFGRLLPLHSPSPFGDKDMIQKQMMMQQSKVEDLQIHASARVRRLVPSRPYASSRSPGACADSRWPRTPERPSSTSDAA